jgi:signal peptidase I
MHDEEFLEKLDKINNLPHIPDAHKKYNLLPGRQKYGGDAIFYPPSSYRAIEKLLPAGEQIMPYHESHAEYYATLDELIAKHGAINGEPNELGKMIADYKKHIQKINNKENWSVLRYIGKSGDFIGVFGYTHGRYYYMAVDESCGYYGIFDDEEYYPGYKSLNNGPLGGASWEIAEDPTGMAAKLLFGENKKEKK